MGVRWCVVSSAVIAVGCVETAKNDVVTTTSTGSTGETGTDGGTEGLPTRPNSVRCQFDGVAPHVLPPIDPLPWWQDANATGLTDVAASVELERTFIARFAGQVIAIDENDGDTHRTVLDLTDRANRVVSIAIAPDHYDSGHLYLRYEPIAEPPRAVISRFTADPVSGVIDPTSERVVMEVPDAVGPGSGGALAFDDTERLLIGIGSGYAPNLGEIAQDRSSRIGKILRIDVDSLDTTGSFTIPPDNPFVGDGPGYDEVWAYGFRDPLRCTFDAGDARPWCIDVGIDEQEVNHVSPGANLGWPWLDGTTCLLTGGDCGDLPTSGPVATYRTRDGDCGISGAIISRDSTAPEYDGAVLYSDRCSGRIRGLRLSDDIELIQDEILAQWSQPISGLGLASDGKVLVVGDDEIAAVVATQSTASFPTKLSQSGCFDDLAALVPSPGVIPYGINSPLWTDGAIKNRYLMVPPGSTITIAEDGSFEFPVGTILLKMFSFEFVQGDPDTQRPIETRVMVRRDLGWQFHSYRWNAAGTDATVLDTDETTDLTLEQLDGPLNFDYTWPSRAGCKVCHGLGTSHALGPRLDQLNGEFDYGSAVANQLDEMKRIGLFAAELPDASKLARMPSPSDETSTLSDRARAYLDANCGHCHRPGGWTPAMLDMDLRYKTAFADSATCGVDIEYYNPWVSATTRITPGDPDESALWQRINRRDFAQMPPLATHLVDPQSDVVRQWIASLSACPE